MLNGTSYINQVQSFLIDREEKVHHVPRLGLTFTATIHHHDICRPVINLNIGHQRRAHIAKNKLNFA